MVLIACPAWAEKQYIYLGADRIVLGSDTPFLGYVSPYLIGASQDAATLGALITAGYPPAASKTINIVMDTTETGALDLSAMDGGSGTEIVFTLQGDWTLAAGGLILGDYYIINCAGHSIIGPILFGDNFTSSRCLFKPE